MRLLGTLQCQLAFALVPAIVVVIAIAIAIVTVGERWVARDVGGRRFGEVSHFVIEGL